jgi:hypothetical protein
LCPHHIGILGSEPHFPHPGIGYQEKSQNLRTPPLLNDKKKRISHDFPLLFRVENKGFDNL